MRTGRRHPKLDIWKWLARWSLVPIGTAIYKKRWQGVEHVPAQGAAIVALNHISYADPLCAMHFVYDCGRMPRFLAKSSLFKIFFIGLLLRKTGQIPVYRGSTEAKEALSAALQMLDDGEAVIVYPEGTVTRDPDWWPMQAQTGIARLALAHDAPVVPVAQWGAQHAVDVYGKKFRVLPPRKKVTFLAGPPVDLSAYRGKEVTLSLLKDTTEAIMRAIADLEGQLRGETPPEVFFKRPRESRKAAEKKSA